jgi:NAD(P)H-hydrate epimerase
MKNIDIHTIQLLFKRRSPISHKGNHGHALVIAGSKDKMGAAIISVKSALRAGAGLVTAAVPKKERGCIFNAVPEAMVVFREDKTDLEKYAAIAIGPGMGTDKAALQKITLLTQHFQHPIVVDADALTILASNQLLLHKLPFKSILTPHVKEFDRLFGNPTSESERRQVAISKAIEYKCIIVLKEHRTFITDGISSFENTTGNSGLAKGGSGDALTGIICAFLAQGYEPINAAILGVYLHGLASDITLKTQSSESMLITDVVDNLGQAFYQIQQ